jgi:hypothetical protein
LYGGHGTVQATDPGLILGRKGERQRFIHSLSSAPPVASLTAHGHYTARFGPSALAGTDHMARHRP